MTVWEEGKSVNHTLKVVEKHAGCRMQATIFLMSNGNFNVHANSVIWFSTPFLLFVVNRRNFMEAERFKFPQLMRISKGSRGTK